MLNLLNFNAKFAAHANKKARQECGFLLVETHKHLTSIAVLTAHVETSLLYTFQRSMPAIKTQQISHYRHAKKNQWTFLLYSTGVNISSRNNFANLGSFAKVSVTVQFITPWFVLIAMRITCSFHHFHLQLDTPTGTAFR